MERFNDHSNTCTCTNLYESSFFENDGDDECDCFGIEIEQEI